jgi:hypothetical protein
MSKKTHKLRGVMLLPELGRKGTLYPLTTEIVGCPYVTPSQERILSSSTFDRMDEHDKLRTLKALGIRHVPQYT